MIDKRAASDLAALRSKLIAEYGFTSKELSDLSVDDLMAIDLAALRSELIAEYGFTSDELSDLSVDDLMAIDLAATESDQLDDESAQNEQMVGGGEAVISGRGSASHPFAAIESHADPAVVTTALHRVVNVEGPDVLADAGRLRALLMDELGSQGRRHRIAVDAISGLTGDVGGRLLHAPADRVGSLLEDWVTTQQHSEPALARWAAAAASSALGVSTTPTGHERQWRPPAAAHGPQPSCTAFQSEVDNESHRATVRLPFSAIRLTAAGLFALTAILIVIGSVTTLSELRFYSPGSDRAVLDVIDRVTAWSRSTYPPDYYGEELNAVAYGLPLVAAALTAVLATILLLVSGRSVQGTQTLSAARVSACVALGLLLGIMTVLVSDVIGTLRLHELQERLVTTTGAGAWLLGASVLVAICATGLAAVPSTGNSEATHLPTAAVSATPRLLGAASLVLAGVAVSLASTLTILSVEDPGQEIFGFSGWAFTPAAGEGLPQFGYAYIGVGALLVVSGVLVGIAARQRRGALLIGFAPGMGGFAAASALGLFWAMAVYVAWIGSFFDEHDGLFSVGWGIWLLLAGVCLAVIGTVLAGLDHRRTTGHEGSPSSSRTVPAFQ